MWVTRDHTLFVQNCVLQCYTIPTKRSNLKPLQFSACDAYLTCQHSYFHLPLKSFGVTEEIFSRLDTYIAIKFVHSCSVRQGTANGGQGWTTLRLRLIRKSDCLYNYSNYNWK